MDRLSEMEAFARVVELGGFTEAARRMGVSKSAVSKAVAALEERLGARLLTRTTRRVAPTAIGAAFYERARRVIEEAEEAERMVTALHGAPRGELRVSAPVSFGLRVLAPAVADFMRQNPEVTLTLSLDDRFVELVSAGFDMAVRIGRLPDSSLKALRLRKVDLLLAASPEYLARAGVPRRIEDLADHQLLRYAHQATGASWRLRGPGGEERQVRARGRLVADNGDALALAAEAGLGIVLSPDFIIAEALAAGRLVEVLPECRPEPAAAYAVRPAGPFPPPQLSAFVDFLAQRLRDD
ncbi:LysR family transcriptional regulator [Oceanicella actignis]|uniref:DNA-binding transcriptional regulator, LysR family n=1 Tax=Oceanicella actignis TaxID=1189325 RepID=A0A1M7S1D0_9RHOB|nr:LysR family transcriptional regulator [Oceanicella actignis]TYO90136.1 DNA-binding transcriptional LysR family regulator [Oceanicella actignis]SES92070.1 transcriptional regulator, LysR family [Oceanicella actignis]SHN52298.1 DNA-binding transcriptional regulator, LysR family [Oceanicella actignis]